MAKSPPVSYKCGVKPQTLSVRLATRDDAAAIAAMSRDEIERGLPWSWTEARVARAIGDPETNVIVAGPEGLLAGFGIMSYKGDEAHLLLFAVAITQRRRGVGSAILEWLERVAREPAYGASGSSAAAATRQRATSTASRATTRHRSSAGTTAVSTTRSCSKSTWSRPADAGSIRGAAG